jgi:hypothetical protein
MINNCLFLFKVDEFRSEKEEIIGTHVFCRDISAYRPHTHTVPQALLFLMNPTK